MSKSLKERIADDLKQAQQEGSLRTDKIREIVKMAVEQTIAEFKGGSREIRPVLKDIIMAIIETLGEKDKLREEEITTAIEGTIEEIKDLPEEIKDSPSQVSIMIQKPASVTFKIWLKILIKALKEGNIKVWLQAQSQQLDGQLAHRYGDRYQMVKQQLDQTAIWYNETKEKMIAGEPSLFEQTQSELKVKIGEVGTTFAQKEEQFKQRLQAMWKAKNLSL